MAKDDLNTPDKNSSQSAGQSTGQNSSRSSGSGGSENNIGKYNRSDSGGSKSLSDGLDKAGSKGDKGLSDTKGADGKDIISDNGKATNPEGPGGKGVESDKGLLKPKSEKGMGQKLQTAKRVGKAAHAGAKGYGAVGLLSKFMNAAQAIAAMAANAVANTLGFFAQIGAAIAGFIQGIASAVGSFVGGIVSFVGNVLGVGATVAATVVGGISAIGAFLGIGAAAAVVSNNNVAQKDDKVADCEEDVLSYGIGDGKIPEKIGDFRIGYTTTWEASLEWMDSHISSGTNQRTVVDMVKTNHRYDEHGFSRFGNYYIVAIAPTPFGTSKEVDARVGDYITFYLSDGTALECIVGDTKGDVKGSRTDGKDGGKYNFREFTKWDEVVPVMTPTGPATISAYGHTYANDVNVLEFWGKVSSNNHFEMITGKKGLRVASFTNHGYAKEYSEYCNKKGVSLAEAAKSTASAASANARGTSKDNCVKTRHYDNSSLALAAASYAHHSAKEAEMNDGTELYQKVHRAVFPGDDYFQSCDRSVTTAIRWSGTDTNVPEGGCSKLIEYFDSSDRWKKVGDENTMKSTDLQPGDVVICPSHVCIFVGEAAIKQIHGDKAQPGMNSVSGSIGKNNVNRGPGSRSPGVDTSAADVVDGKYDGRFYSVYRCVNPEHSDKYAHAAD